MKLPLRRLNLILVLVLLYQLKNAEIIRFGEKIHVNVRLPLHTDYKSVAQKFFSSPSLIVESVYGMKCQRLNADDSKFTLSMGKIKLPGTDNEIVSEFDAIFNVMTNGISMRSDKWRLSGAPLILSDHSFMTSFNLVVVGEVTLKSDSTSGNLFADGWVDYKVQSAIPQVFKLAPTFAIKTVTKAIEYNIQSFVTKEFNKKFLQSFRKFASNELRDKVDSTPN